MASNLTDDTKAILLLCGVFGQDRSVTPLTPTEYNALTLWLRRATLRPASLLQQPDTSKAAAGSGIDKTRLEKLLGRGVQLGFSVEEWQRCGLWVISRSDDEYPARYKSHLKEKAPPLLFGAGDKSLLRGGGLAIVGSRNVDMTGENFTRHVAEDCAFCNIPVVSGGARGVDQTAMRSALEAGGRVIGILAENLLKASIEKHARYALADGRMLLISPYHPNARFTVGTAMGRNKLIYALADYGLVVSADYNKGGTWSGAVEELKREKPIPVFVRTGQHVPEGNLKLLEQGAQQWPDNIIQGELANQLAELAALKSTSVTVKTNDPQQMRLLDINVPSPSNNQPALQRSQPETPAQPVDCPKSPPQMTVYDVVLPTLLAHLQQPVSADDLAKELDVNKTQLNVWLKRAVDEGRIRKLKKPVRYSV